MRAMLRAIASSPINLLLVVAPVSWFLAATAGESPWLFITAAVSLIPLAGLIGLGTEQLAERSGPALGGFLNATFGNAAELIIAVVALRNGHIALVKASITGSIVGNLLLVLGLSFFVGGLGRRTQQFHRTGATNTAAMLFLAVVALVMPAVFDLALYGTLEAHPAAIDRLSFWSALILIGAYAGSLIYAFTVQRDLFRPTQEGHHDGQTFSTGAALAVLLLDNGAQADATPGQNITVTSGEIVFRQIALPDVQGRHILILDDILDSGVTLAAIRGKLAAEQPRSVRICVLLRKVKGRLRPVDADYVGFNIGDEFVVGYGLDYMEHYRNLPCIGVLRKDRIAS